MQLSDSVILDQLFEKCPQVFMEGSVVYGRELFHQVLLATYKGECVPEIPKDVRRRVEVYEGPKSKERNQLMAEIQETLREEWVEYLLNNDKDLNESLEKAQKDENHELADLIRQNMN